MKTLKKITALTLFAMVSPLILSAEDQVIFRNQDRLTGSFQGYSPDALHWKPTHGDETMEFSSGEIDELRWEPKLSEIPLPEITLRFRNGDWMPATLISAEKENILVTSTVCDSLRIPYALLHSIDFHTGSPLRFQGPLDASKWSTNNSPPVWKVGVDGLITHKPGVTGRKLDLSDRTSISFTLEWERYLYFAVSWYANHSRSDRQPGAYTLQCQYNTFTLQRGLEPEESSPEAEVDGPPKNQRLQDQLNDFQKRHALNPVKNIGPPVNCDFLHRRRSVVLTIYSDPTAKNISLMINGEPIKTWNDPDGFKATGSFLLFSHRGNSPWIRCRDIRVGSWNGLLPESEEDLPGEQPTLFLLNNDRVEGAIVGGTNRRLEIETAVGPLRIQTDRMARMVFPVSESGLNMRNDAGGSIAAAYLNGGGRLSLAIKKMGGDRLVATSPGLGGQVFRRTGFHSVVFLSDSKEMPSPFWLPDPGSVFESIPGELRRQFDDDWTPDE